MREISREYFENDPVVQELVQYLHSEEFLTAWKIFTSYSEVEDIFAWIKNHGVNLEHEIELFCVEIDQITPSHIFHELGTNLKSEDVHGFSIQAFEDELRDEILFEDLNKLIDELLESGNDFAHLYLIFRVSRPALERLFEDEEIQQAIGRLEMLGVDVDAIKASVYDILRWN